MGDEEDIKSLIYDVLSEYDSEYGEIFKSIETLNESVSLTNNKSFIIKDFDNSEFQIIIVKIK